VTCPPGSGHVGIVSFHYSHQHHINATRWECRLKSKN